MNIKIGIIDFGAGNLYAIYNACVKIGCNPEIIQNKDYDFDNYGALIIPGVGSFSSAMNKIIDLGFFDKIIKFKKSGKLIFGICLGMQLLASKSYEGKETSGFNFINATVTSVVSDLKGQIPKDLLRAPITGWNSVYFTKENKKFFIDNNQYEYQDFYFIHSYWIKSVEDKFLVGKSFYMNKDFCSCFKKENIVGTQFHPERSGEKGLIFLEKILNTK